MLKKYLNIVAVVWRMHGFVQLIKIARTEVESPAARHEQGLVTKGRILKPGLAQALMLLHYLTPETAYIISNF